MKLQMWISSGVFIALAILGSPALSAQCTVMSYKVFRPNRIGIRCNSSMTVLPVVVSGSGMKVGDATVTNTVSPYTVTTAVVRLAPGSNSDWLSVELIGTPVLLPSTKYSIAITLLPTIVGQPGTAIPGVSIDTTSTYTVNPAKAADLPKTYVFKSATVALYPPASGVCTLKVTTSLVTTSHDVPVSNCNLRDQVLKDDWDEAGIVNVTLNRAAVLQMAPDSLTGPTDAFGNAPTVPKTARMSVLKAPATKDVAAFYMNLSFVGATGASPAWTLDGKFVPSIVPGLLGGFEINPFVGTANVGQGSIPSAKFTDTIDLGSNVVRTFEPQNKILDAWTLTPGVTSETDKEFDTWNVLGTVDFKLNFAHTYHPQLRKRLQDLAALISSDSTRSWTIGDVAIPNFGYVFEVHPMLEAGKKIGDSTVQNSSKTTSLDLPEYSILRPALQLHELLQWRRLSADSVFTGRYLAVTEQSVLERADKTLYLYSFHGWKGYQTLTGAYQIDPIGRWALSVTYNTGFAPPKYARTNSVQVGVTVKY